jgi:hypothetical protein
MQQVHLAQFVTSALGTNLQKNILEHSRTNIKPAEISMTRAISTKIF